MSKKQWMVLLMLFLTYLLLGASMFYHIESRLEIERVEMSKRERIEINALLHAHYVPSPSHEHDEILGKLSRYCGRSVYNYTEGETDPLKWDFYNSFYFAYTVVSTIGYGNLAPTNMLGRILMIFYGLIGIPMNGILLTHLGEFFGRVFVKAHRKYKTYKHGRNEYYPRKFEKGKVGLAVQIFVHLMPGFVMFIFFPAFLFSYYEGWSYDEAVYYAFVTLTTIGFGDYVAGQDNSKGSGVFFQLYKTFLICWISFGLGYTVMIMTFIARGMRSKKITRIEHKLAINLKHTQSKIWNEFNKEINYLRRVFNELQLSKVRRVYVDECPSEIPPSKLPRSNSFPDLRVLSFGSKAGDQVCSRPRRRANSEVVPTDDQVTRVVSETDLQRIDKTATFASHAMVVQPAELLARLVNILGYMPPATEELAGDGSDQATTFVGQDIARTRLEESSNGKEFSSPFDTVPGTWTIGRERIPRFPPPRSRATSEIKLTDAINDERCVERTWSGPTAARKMQDLLKARTSESSAADRHRGIKESKFAKLRGLALAKSIPRALASSGPWKSRFSTSAAAAASAAAATAAAEKRNSVLENDANGSRADTTEHSFVQGPTPFEERRDSTSTASNIRRHYYTHTGAAGNNLDVDGPSNLLEETSLADFLRAITLLHATVEPNAAWPVSGEDEAPRRTRPRRKMGTASLTPPKLPSLFTLFSPFPSASSPSQSNQTTITQASNGNWSEGKPGWVEARRESVARDASSSVARAPNLGRVRKFSLRPVATPVATPVGPPTPPRNVSPLLTDSRRMRCDSRAKFLFESPKEPLIRTEGAPGLSSPIKPPLNERRFSLRSAPNQNGTSTGISNAALAPTLKSLPRWKAGMLQRQIGQMHVRRRARAFSLSDVYTEETTEPLGLPAPPSTIYKKNVPSKNVTPLHEDSGLWRDTRPHPVELSERIVSSSSSSTSASTARAGPRYSTPSTAARVDEKNVRIIEPQTKTKEIAVPAGDVDRGNRRAAYSRSGSGLDATSQSPLPEPLRTDRNRVDTCTLERIGPQRPVEELNASGRNHSVDLTEVKVDKLEPDSTASDS